MDMVPLETIAATMAPYMDQTITVLFSKITVIPKALTAMATIMVQTITKAVVRQVQHTMAHALMALTIKKFLFINSISSFSTKQKPG